MEEAKTIRTIPPPWLMASVELRIFDVRSIQVVSHERVVYFPTVY